MKNIILIIKIFSLAFLSIFYTIPKLFFIYLFKKNYINLVFSSKKIIRRKDFYMVNFNFESDLIWNPFIPLPFINKKVKSIYSIHFLDKIHLSAIEDHIKYCTKDLLAENGNYISSVRDASSYMQAYSNKRFSLYTNLFKNNILHNYGFIDQINHLHREGNKTLFDEEFIKNLFLKNGFKNIQLREFNYSFDIPQNFHDSIYFEAFK